MKKIMGYRKRNIPQEAIELTVTGLSHEGRGIARHQDKIVFVFGALPGETVKAKYTRCYSRYDEATTIEVLVPSKDRVTPGCPHFGVCGGCQLQHLEQNAQIAFKQSIVQEQLEHIAKVTPKEWLAPLTGESFGYRQKARLGVRYVFKKEALLVGFREQKNCKIALIENCHVLDKRVGLKISALRELINGLQARNEIAQIEVAIGKEEVGLVFRHLVPLCSEDQAALIQFCQQHQFSLYLQPDKVESIHKIWPENSSVFLSYEQEKQNLRFDFHPCDFTQVNQTINQKMINAALDLLAPTQSDRILDLFCGLGNFSLPFAQKAHQVVGVEGSAMMVERANHNAKLNQIDNALFYAADLEGDFASQAWAREQFTKVILDPPRSGAEKMIAHLSTFNANEILYISCNSATFARDAAMLVHQHGYDLEKVGVMDMFVHTAHVETIGLFKRHG